jgi:lysophospholipase L1-like esterase
MRVDVTRVACAVGLVLVIGASGEVTARIEDYFRRGIPILHTPDRTGDLVLHDQLGIRGRPNGHFGRWQLNSVGFRGPEIARQPEAGCSRVLVLGASESFGLYESDHAEYPAQLGDRLRVRKSACYEVVNASLFGLTLPDITRLWESWGRQFGARTVTIYPTPAFYLAERPPEPPGAPPARVDGPPWWTPRLLGRAEDLIDYPAFIQRRRVAKEAAALEAAHDPRWFYQAVPPDRLAQFTRDLDTLIVAIQAAGAAPVLITHATGFHRPPDEATQGDALESWRLHMRKPRAPVLLDFEERARQATLALAQQRGVEVVDAAAVMNGHDEWFAEDLLHFNDRGAARLADLLAERVTATDPRPQQTTRRDAAAPMAP